MGLSPITALISSYSQSWYLGYVARSASAYAIVLAVVSNPAAVKMKRLPNISSSVRYCVDLAPSASESRTSRLIRLVLASVALSCTLRSFSSISLVSWGNSVFARPMSCQDEGRMDSVSNLVGKTAPTMFSTTILVASM